MLCLDIQNAQGKIQAPTKAGDVWIQSVGSSLLPSTGSAGRRSCPLRVSWLVKFNVLLQKAVWKQEMGVKTLRNLWEWWVWPFSSPWARKDVRGRAIYFLHSFGLCLLHFPLYFGVRDWLSACKVGEVLWDNPSDIIDLESPLKEGALTPLNSYFQKHKTYQNTYQDQLVHSILSNLLLPNCNLFL